MECRGDEDSLFCLDVVSPDHLAPLLGFVGDELSKISRRTRKHRTGEVSKPRLHLGVGEARIDLMVELLDNLDRRILGRSETELGTRLEARHKIIHDRHAADRLHHRVEAAPTAYRRVFTWRVAMWLQP